MSNVDVQARLQPITADAEYPPLPQGELQPEPPRVRKWSFSRVGVGGVVMALGIQAVKFTSQNYEAIRDGGGKSVAVAAAVGAAALVLAGFLLILRTVIRKQHSAPAASADHATAQNQVAQRPSRAGQAFFSFLGLIFGVVASFYITLATAARLIGTDKAVTAVNSSVIIAYVLTLVSLGFGFAGIFLRGHSLMRVPAFYIIGAVLSYAAFSVLEVDMHQWPEIQTRLR